MRKIIILSFDYPPNNGGIARLCGEIVQQLELRHTPYLVITNVPSDINNNNIIRILGKRGVIEFKILKYLLSNTSKDDIILCDTWHPAGSIAMLSGRKYYILAHGAEFLPGDSFIRKKIIPLYRRLVLTQSSGIIANSNYTKNLVNSLGKNIKAIALPLAIDSNKFKPTVPKNTKDSILRICSISRLEQFKGHDLIIKTIASLPEDYKNRIKLEIAGKGPYKTELMKLSSSLGLNNIINFLGFIPEEKINDFYSRNDLFILCTREEKELCNVEGFGLVFVEAQSCGTAVIGTNAGGIPDAIHNGRGGWLITQDSINELSKLLKYSINNKDNIQKEGLIARNRVIVECSQFNYADNLLKILNAN